MQRRVRVAIVQSAHDLDDPAENLAQIHAAVQRYRDRDLIVFPELTLHGHHVAAEPPGALRRILRATPAEEVEEFHDLVRQCETRVVFGALVEREGKLLNLAMYTDGVARVSYAKTHVHWTETFYPGTEFPVVHAPFGALGMLICFDAAFPEVPRILALKGARIIVNLSAIPDHFPLEIVHRRLQACSVENQVYTIFANRRGRGFLGGSAAVDYQGGLMKVAGPTDPVLDVELDLDALESWRKKEPLYPHRRPDLYDLISQLPNLTEGSVSEHETPK